MKAYDVLYLLLSSWKFSNLLHGFLVHLKIGKKCIFGNRGYLPSVPVEYWTMTGTYRDVRLSFWSLHDRKTLAHNQHEFRYLISELQYAEFPEKSKNVDFRIFDQN